MTMREFTAFKQQLLAIANKHTAIGALVGIAIFPVDRLLVVSVVVVVVSSFMYKENPVKIWKLHSTRFSVT